MGDGKLNSLSLYVVNNCEEEEQEVGDVDNCFEINKFLQVVFLNILWYLDVKDLGRVFCVFKYWYNFCFDLCLWRILRFKKWEKVNDEVIVRIIMFGVNVFVLDVLDCLKLIEEGFIKVLR